MRYLAKIRDIIDRIWPYLIITGLGLFMFRDIFNPGHMSGYDNSIHYYEAYYLTTKLIPIYHNISGWDMQGMGGCPILLYHPQVGFLLTAFLNQILTIPLNIAYKLSVFFSYIFFGGTFYKLSSYKFGRPAAIITTVCFMLQKDVYCDKILYGIWNNFIGIGIFFIFFYLLEKYRKTIDIRNALALGLVLGLIIPAHLFSAIFAFILLGICFFPYVVFAEKRTFFKRASLYTLIPSLAIAISAYYLYAFFAARNYFSAHEPKELATALAWSIKSLAGPFENTVRIGPTLAVNMAIVMKFVLSMTGIYLFFAEEKDVDTRRFLNCLAIFIVISLLLFSDTITHLFRGSHVPLLTSLQTNRFMIYIQSGMYLFAAYGLMRTLRLLKKKTVFIVIMSVILSVVAFSHYTIFAKEASRMLESSPETKNIFKVWGWINENTSPGNERVIYQSTIGNSADGLLRRSDALSLSGVYTKTPFIGVFLSATVFPQERYVRNDQGRIFNVDTARASVDYIAGMMDLFNAAFIVTVEPELERKLKDSSRFSVVKRYGAFTIFRLLDARLSWVDFEKEATLDNYDIENQKIAFEISNKAVNNEARIKFAYHPFWKAMLNGRSANVFTDEYGLMRINLADSGDNRLNLSYNPRNKMLLFFSVTAIILSILLIFIKREGGRDAA